MVVVSVDDATLHVRTHRRSRGTSRRSATPRLRVVRSRRIRGGRSDVRSRRLHSARDLSQCRRAWVGRNDSGAYAKTRLQASDEDRTLRR